MPRFASCPAFLSLLATTAASALGAQQIATRTVLDFGGLQADPAAEFSGITSTLRLADGQYLVGNSKPAGVRLYSTTGTLVRAIGRAGSGPGEFTYRASVFPWSGDSVLTLSEGARRWMLFRLNGVLVREWPVDSLHPSPFGMGLRNWAFTRTSVTGSRGCVAPVVSRLPAPVPWEPREVLTDQAGRVWVHVKGAQWQIHSPAGTLLGNATLPERFRIMQFAGNLVVGQRFDSDDAEHVTVVQVTLPAAVDAGPLCVLPRPTSPVLNSMRTTVGNLRTAGEAVRSDTGRYPMQIPRALVVVPETLEITIPVADADAWTVILRDRESNARCVTSFGPRGIPGWEARMIACSQ